MKTKEYRNQEVNITRDTEINEQSRKNKNPTEFHNEYKN